MVVTVDLAVELAPARKQELRLRNPVMTASGTFSNGLEFARRFDVDALGALVSKGTTLRPRLGNPQPRVVETAAGMINSIGFQNIGVGSSSARLSRSGSAGECRCSSTSWATRSASTGSWPPASTRCPAWRGWR